ncbi:MAG: hypothetical protein K2X38_00070 [Gemmataceae bacterium]|nr:hypothetical protein [Gemmataceae bacterium]
MSQLFDYFVCSRSTIENWADAMEQQDEDEQARIESEMSGFVTLEHIGQDEFNILAQCVEEDGGDPTKAVLRVDLVKAVDEEEGPWVTAFHPAAVKAVAGMSVSATLIQCWRRAVAAFRGESEELYRKLLTSKTADSLKELCSLAVEKRMEVFTCFYG